MLDYHSIFQNCHHRAMAYYSKNVNFNFISRELSTIDNIKKNSAGNVHQTRDCLKWASEKKIGDYVKDKLLVESFIP